MAKRFEKHQIRALDSAFMVSENLTKEKKVELVSSTGLDVEQITSWFRRKRARKRANELKMGFEKSNGELQKALQESKEREENLQCDLEESKKREAELGAEIWRLKQQQQRVSFYDY